MLSLLTFFWQASAFAQAWLSVQQLALGAGGCCWGSPDHIPVIAKGVPPARVPGGVLSQSPFGLGLETCLMNAVARRGQPVAIDLVDVFVGDNWSSIVFVSRHKRVAQVPGLCGIRRRKKQKGGEVMFELTENEWVVFTRRTAQGNQNWYLTFTLLILILTDTTCKYRTLCFITELCWVSFSNYSHPLNVGCPS